MRAYFSKLRTGMQMVLAVPAVVLAYVIVTMILPAVVHAAIPDVVRQVLQLICPSVVPTEPIKRRRRSTGECRGKKLLSHDVTLLRGPFRAEQSQNNDGFFRRTLDGGGTARGAASPGSR